MQRLTIGIMALSAWFCACSNPDTTNVKNPSEGPTPVDVSESDTASAAETVASERPDAPTASPTGETDTESTMAFDPHPGEKPDAELEEKPDENIDEQASTRPIVDPTSVPKAQLANYRRMRKSRLRVFGKKSGLPDDDEGEDDGRMPTIEKLLAAAAGGAPKTVQVYAHSTIGWGCPCPPLVLHSFASGGPDDALILPVVPKGADNPGDVYLPGTIRMIGHYAAKRQNMLQWQAAQGRTSKPRREAREYYVKPHPVFVVDAWCFKPAGRRHPDADMYRDELKEFARDNKQLLCR